MFIYYRLVDIIPDTTNEDSLLTLGTFFHRLHILSHVATKLMGGCVYTLSQQLHNSIQVNNSSR